MAARAPALWLGLVCVLMLATGCDPNGGGGGSTNGSGGIAAQVIWPPQATSASVKPQPAQAPVGIVTMRFIVSATDMATVQTDILASAGSGNIGSIPVGTNRTLTVQALNGGGTADYTGSASGITVTADSTTTVSVTMGPSGTAVPWPPQQVVASGGNNQITVSWQASSGATGYRVYYKTSPFTSIAGLTPVTTGVVTDSPVTTLTNGTRYYVRVAAFNVNGDSDLSEQSDTVPGGTWATGVALDTVRSLAAVQQVNGTIYATGGRGTISSCCIATAEKFKPGSDAEWSAIAAPATARFGAASAVVNGILYIMGGMDSGDTVINSVEAYNPATNSWTPRSSTGFTARWMPAAAVVDGIIYVMGGSDGSSTIHDVVEAYDPVANTWSTKTVLPTARYGLGAAAVDGTIYAVGGDTGSGTGSQVVEAYDPQGNNWASREDTLVGRVYHSVTEVNGRIHAIGGQTPTENPTAGVEVYDPATNTWSALSVIPTERREHGAANVNGVIYAVGGYDGAAVLNVVETLTPPGNEPANNWTSKAALNTARVGFGIASANGVVFVMGGFGTVSTPYASIEAFDPNLNDWRTTKSDGTTPLAAMPNGLYALSATEVNGKIYVTGGLPTNAASAATAEIWAYDPIANTWDDTLDTRTAARALVMLEAVDGKIYAIGGQDGSSVATKTVEQYDPVIDAWTSKADMPTARMAAMSAVVDGIVYVMGGAVQPSGDFATDVVEAYNPVTNTWSTRTPMPIKMAQTRAVTVDGLIYVAGGANFTTSYLDTLYVYDPVANEWSAKADMPTDRYYLGVAAVNGQIYSVGGQNGSGQLATTEAYAP